MKSKIMRLGMALAVIMAACMPGRYGLPLVGAADGPAPVAGAPVFEVDPAWPKIPAQWKLGDISSIALDDKDNVWVLHRPRTLPEEHAAAAAPPVVVFDSTGRFIQAWGGESSEYEWPEREHGIHVDYRGYVWIGGNHCASDIRKNERGIKPFGDDYLLKLTQAGKLIMQIGRRNQSTGNADTKNLRQPADAFVYAKTNEVFVADGYGNHRVAVFDADTGDFKRMWGAFGNKPVDNVPCPPTYPATVAEGNGPGQFSTVHAIRVSNDGFVYVADREYRRVQVFTLDGKFIRQVVRNNEPFGRNLALSSDPAQQFLYVGGGAGIVVLDRKNLQTVSVISGGGVIGGGHEIATDSKGNLYIAQPGTGMQKLIFKGIAPLR